MPSPAKKPNEGLPARQAALRILDAVLRRGQTMDNAAQAARGLPPADAALASAIAGETLRRLPDLDALIDGATKQRLPDDAKARTVLRLALAQKIGLGTPDHALVATALPLVDGGPRRLVHGVLGALLRKGMPPLDAPRLPETVEERWRAAWGDEMVLAARRAIAHRPPLDISFASAEACAAFPEGVALAPRHRRIAHGGAVTELPGYGEGGWWVQDLAASLPARLIPADAEPRIGRLRGARRQDHATRCGRPSSDRARPLRKSSGPTFRQSFANRARGGHRCRRCAGMGSGLPVRCRLARCALLGNRHLPPPSRSALPGPAGDHRTKRGASGAAARTGRRLGPARRKPRLCRLQPRAARKARSGSTPFSPSAPISGWSPPPHWSTA